MSKPKTKLSFYKSASGGEVRQIGIQTMKKEKNILGSAVLAVLFSFMLINSANAKAFTFSKNLYYNLRNGDVAVLQKVLIYEGCLKTTATGYFGSATRGAVKCFQRKYNFTSIPSSGHKANKRAVVIIYKNVYDALRPEMDNFQKDVADNLGVGINIIQLQNSLAYTPLDIRNLLIKECKLDGKNGCPNLEGAVLVGDIPYAWYAQPHAAGEQAPFMYFYEDLDAGFKQNNSGH